MHVPLTPDTRRLVNTNFLTKLKPNAVLVNTSRGGVLDQAALYETLKQRRIFAAALDVTDPSRCVDDPLLELDNCIIVPHIASASIQSRDMMAFLSAKNLIAGVNGEHLPHCVNPEVYQRVTPISNCCVCWLNVWSVCLLIPFGRGGQVGCAETSLKLLEEIDAGQDVKPARISPLIRRAYEILQRAAQEIPDIREIMKK